MKIVDLTAPCYNQTEGGGVQLQQNLLIYFGHECGTSDLSIKSNTNTCFKTSEHLFSNGQITDSIPLVQLILLDICLRVENTKSCIAANDLKKVLELLALFAVQAVLINAETKESNGFQLTVLPIQIEKMCTVPFIAIAILKSNIL